jgi:hypothetical protein
MHTRVAGSPGVTQVPGELRGEGGGGPWGKEDILLVASDVRYFLILNHDSK